VIGQATGEIDIPLKYVAVSVLVLAATACGIGRDAPVFLPDTPSPIQTSSVETQVSHHFSTPTLAPTRIPSTGKPGNRPSMKPVLTSTSIPQPVPASTATPLGSTTLTPTTTKSVDSRKITRNPTATAIPHEAKVEIEVNPSLILEILDETSASYSIGETLTWFPDPITAIARTSGVTGEIIFNGDGSIDEESSIIIDVSTLKSDKPKRDGWVRRSSGLGNKVIFAVKETPGMPWPIPESGSTEFVILGDMSIAGDTIPSEWNVSATFNPDSVSGTASTEVTWNEIGLSKPGLSFIISVDDNIFLEIDFVTSR